jgi:hypothetical protein
MSDMYRVFSQIIPELTAAEVAWLKANLVSLYDMFEKFGAGDNPNDFPEIVAWREEFGFGPDDIIEDIDSWPNFGFEIGEPGGELWIYSDEGGDLEHVISLTQAFLGKFRPTEFFTMSYADYCSKPLIGAQGGGAIRVTATDGEYFHTDAWLEEKSRLAKKPKDKGIVDQGNPNLRHVNIRFSTGNAAFADNFEGELRRVLSTIPDKLVRISQRAPCVCDAPEDDDHIRDAAGNIIGTITTN